MSFVLFIIFYEKTKAVCSVLPVRGWNSSVVWTKLASLAVILTLTFLTAQPWSWIRKLLGKSSSPRRIPWWKSKCVSTLHHFVEFFRCYFVWAEPKRLYNLQVKQARVWRAVGTAKLSRHYFLNCHFAVDVKVKTVYLLNENFFYF